MPKPWSLYKRNEIPKVWGCNDMKVHVEHPNGDMEESKEKNTSCVIKKLSDHQVRNV